MPRRHITLNCPTCRGVVAREDEFFPFCSDRCRLIDLGKWASGAYKISSPVLDPDLIEDQPSSRSDDKSPGDDDDGGGKVH